MVLSNRDRVGRGLEFLASGLGPFVHARMEASAVGPGWAEVLAARDRSRYGGPERRYLLSDPRFLPRVVTEDWGTFKGPLSLAHRGFASELRDTGNRWAHGEAFSAADAYRALDTIERLLTAVGAAEQASQAGDRAPRQATRTAPWVHAAVARRRARTRAAETQEFAPRPVSLMSGRG